MFNKKFLFVLILSMVAVVAVSAVSAADANRTDDIAIVNDDIKAMDEITEISESAVGPADDLAISGEGNSSDVPANDEVLGDDDYDSEELDSIITASQSGTYLHEKVIKVKLTDLNGKPLVNKRIYFEVYKKGHENEDTVSYWFEETNSKGIATYKMSGDWIDSGTYTIKCISGETFAKDVTLKNVKVIKKSLTIKASNLVTTYNSGKTFNIRLVDSSGKGMGSIPLRIKIYTKDNVIKGFTSNTNSKGYIKIKTSGLSLGYHKVDISYVRDWGFALNSKKANIKITKIPLLIKPISRYNKESGIIHIKVLNKITKKPIDGIKLTVRIFTGSKYKTYVLGTGYDSKIYKSHGIAAIETNKFTIGNHKVLISALTNYCQGSSATILKIPPTAKFYNKFTGLISYGKRVVDA